MLSVVFAFFIALSARADKGEYDLRFVQVESAKAGVALIDIEMRATASDKEFHLAEQNFRFLFNEDAVFPFNAKHPSVIIEQELDASGQVAQSFYAPHHLNGSAQNLISYNVELLAGEGLRIASDEWTKIGRLAFQLKSPDAQLNLTWQSVDNFPPTYISEKRNNRLARINEGSLENFASMMVDIDDPIAVSDAIRVFPNPTTNNTTVNLMMNSEKVRGAGQIIISDALGRTISTQAISIVKGIQNYNLNVEVLLAGTYRVHIQTSKWQSISQPLIVIEK